MQSVTSNAVAEALSYSETEHQVSTWIDGSPLYEKTQYVRTPNNGGYTINAPTNIRVRRWFGNYFHSSMETPDFIHYVPFTLVSTNGNVQIYTYYEHVNHRFYINLLGTGSFTSYFNGYVIITYQYTKN